MEKAIAILKTATNIQPILDKLRSGRIMLQLLSILYRIIAVILGVSLLAFWVVTWGVIGELNFFGGLALLVWQVFFPYASFLVAKVLYVRAREISDYPDSDYVVVPVLAMLTRTNGEMALAFFAVMSVPAMILTWFAGGAVDFLGAFDGVGNAFFGGIVAFFTFWAIGFFALILMQLLAEWTLAIFSIANDANILRRHLTKEDMPESGQSQEPSVS